MSELKEIQSLFQAAVMGGETDFLSRIDDSGKISPERRLHIYQHAYRARLGDVLAEDFPVLHTMLGDEVFYGLCRQYIDRHPSSHPSLRYFGQHLEDMVTREPPYRNNPIVGEMARFEWIFHDVFDAPDRDIATIEEVGALDPSVWTTLRFSFHPSLHIAPYNWNVAAVWTSVQDEHEQPTLPVKLPEMSHVIQWRRDLLSYFRTLDMDEAMPLRLAMDNKAFPQICESLVPSQGENAAPRAAELLKGWIAEGLISGLDYLKLGG